MHFSKLLLAASAVVVVSAMPAGDMKSINCPMDKPNQYCCNGGGLLSLSCTDLPIIGLILGGSKCNQMTYCCENKADQQGGPIALNVNLLNCVGPVIL
ncbi:hypothetical protein K440DRAFT_622552 [Wilcoxina mikolae CBS 423.85]|nr:hypothetical protein K440DRAFT_622552 [Wilcoxina mikolae CBS 423.85]